MSIPKTIGRYEILDELGHGAMGSVFRAHDPAMDRIVALKTILSVALASEQGSEYRQRFYREARAAGAMAHPGIVAVFDVGEHEGVPFLVMEFVQGRTLADAMKTGERASLERVCEIGEQIAEALGYAHRHGVIHRDIKPANILLTSREIYGAERPKITDFGVAKLASQGITTTGQMLGTPAFMPPEQFTGAPIDGRTDLFSLGVILYWMATGEQPFPGESMTSVSYKIVHTEPAPPAKLNPAIPPRMEGVIMKCLAKNPANRYQTGEELARDLALLRADSMATGLLVSGPQAMGTGGGSEETLDSGPGAPRKPLPAAAGPVVAAPQPGATAPKKKRGALLLLAAILLAAIAAGGGYMLHRNHPAAQLPAPTASPQARPEAPEAAETPEAREAPETPEARGAPETPAAEQSRSKTPAAAFDPKTLDPKQNARLKLELDHFPPALAFTVEMNGKIYFKGAAGDKGAYEDLFVPPGVQQFRVTARAGNVQKSSNTVSAEFVAKKRMTLRVELRPPAGGSSASLDPAAQLIAALKADRFFF
jgi:serine/threonine-protein kinase